MLFTEFVALPQAPNLYGWTNVITILVSSAKNVSIVLWFSCKDISLILTKYHRVLGAKKKARDDLQELK